MRCLTLLAAAAVTAAATACSTSRPPSQLQQIEKVNASPAELRHRVRSLAPPFAGVLEDAADRIGAMAATREERLFATRMKVEGVPSLFAALFRADPVEAFIDTWVFTVQLKNFFVAGRGAVLLSPPARDIAAAACDTLQDQLAEQARQVAPNADLEKTAKWLREWAEENPIRSLASRPSTAALFARLVAEPPLGAAQTAGKISEDVSDLAARLDFLAATLPKLTRWQAEQLILEVAGTPDVRALLAAGTRAGTDVSRALSALDRAVELLEALPAEAGNEREEVMRALGRERASILEAARAEREAMQAFLTGERRGLFESVRSERAALLKEVERQRRETLAEAAVTLERVLGRFALQLGAAAALGGAAVAGLAYALGRRSRPS